MDTEQDSDNDSLPRSFTGRISRLAHKGVGIAEAPDGRVMFVDGGLPGDEARLKVTGVAKRHLRGEIDDIINPSEFRVAQRCPAAAAGAGCCDFGHVDPTAEMRLKTEVVLGQLKFLGQLDNIPEIDTIDPGPAAGWRTRMRLGVDDEGRAGLRVASSNQIVTSARCMQAVEGMLEGVVGSGAKRFTPGSDIAVAVDQAGTGQRHIVELRMVRRGRRSERVANAVEGGIAKETVGGHTWRVPAAGFWQAHAKAPAVLTEIVSDYLRIGLADSSGTGRIGWDLYGGAGLFIPPLLDVLGAGGKVQSVEASTQATASGREALADLPAQFFTGDVRTRVHRLAKPEAVVLDPPRKGAGKEVIEAVVAARPAAIVAIGCDPAGFAHDVKLFTAGGYRLVKIVAVNLFPGTHHVETVGLLTPA